MYTQSRKLMLASGIALASISGIVVTGAAHAQVSVPVAPATPIAPNTAPTVNVAPNAAPTVNVAPNTAPTTTVSPTVTLPAAPAGSSLPAKDLRKKLPLNAK